MRFSAGKPRKKKNAASGGGEKVATLAQLIVKIGADTGAFTKGMTQVSKETQAFQKKMEGIGNKMQGIGQGMAAGITLPLLGVGAASFKLASDMDESLNKVKVAFGANAKEVETWAGTTLKNYGIAKGTALDMSATFGDMATSMGLNTAQASQMSMKLVGLAGDLASFKNISVEVANTALNGVFTGETESLKKLGIVMTQVNLQEYAHSQGIQKKIQDMTQAEQVMLRYNYILENTKNAQGDFDRTSAGAANQMRIFTESLKELGATIGKDLLPLITPVITKMNEWVQAFANLSPTAKKIILIIAGIAAVMGPLLIIVGGAVSLFGSLAIAAGTLGIGIGALVGIIGGVLVAIAALVAAGVAIYKNWDTIKYYGLQAWGGLKIGVMKAIDAIAGAYERLYGWVPVLGAKIKSVHAQIRKSIEEEQNILKNRVMGSGTTGMADFRQLDNNSVASQANGIVPDLEALMASVGSGSGGGGGGGAAGAAVKAAEDTRAAWEKTADLLGVKLQVLTTQYDTLAASTKMSGDKTIEFALKNNALNDQMKTQQAIVDAVNEGYIRGLNNTELTIEEKEKLRLRLEQEKKALADLQLQQYENIKAQKAMADSLKALSVRVTEAAETYRNDMAAALEEYKKKCADVNAQLIADEQNVTAEFEKTVAQRAEALSNFVGLFEAVSAKEVSGSTLLSNLKGQVETFAQWQSNINALGAKGIDEGLMAELRSMGPSAAAEIAALNTLSAPELAEYVNLWQQKSNMARVSAEAELETQRMETVAKIAQLREDAAIQLQAYKVEWEKKNEEIRKNTLKELETIAKEFEDITGKSYSQGAALVLNFAEGMESEFTTLQSTIDTMYGIVGAGTPSVKVQSPSNVVPINGSTVTNNSISINVTGANAREIWEELGPEIERKLVLAGV